MEGRSNSPTTQSLDRFDEDEVQQEAGSMVKEGAKGGGSRKKRGKRKEGGERRRGKGRREEKEERAKGGGRRKVKGRRV